ncbi:MAG TPA: hypothetical protein VGB73_20490 [Pyrinomonadaceae bacterium]|jgi:hypothetical protein
MRGKLACVWLVVVCVCLSAACGRREVSAEAVLAEVDSFTSELLQRVNRAQDPSAGVDEAQKFLDERRAELASKIAAVKKSSEFERDDALRKRMLESEITNGARVSALQTRHIRRSMDDEAFKAKLERLVNEYQLMFKV